MVFCADSLEEVIEPLNKGPYPSISLFLSFGNFKDIASPIEKKYYKGQHFHYPVELMLKLTVIKFYREIPFRKLKESLTQEDLECLFTCEELKTGVKIPSGKTVHHFLYYRLGKEGVIDLMQLLGKEIVHYLNKPDFTSEQKNLIVDSTPLEASRYSDANFNSHYKIFMSKAHIVSFCGYPLYMRYSNGNDNDAPFGRELIRHISEMKPETKYFLADGGYDNKQMYADIVQLLHTTPIISFREDAIIDKYAEPDAIDRRINKLWKRGGDVSLPIEKKLEFLYNLNPISGEKPTKYKEIVGGYYRNQALRKITKVEIELKNRGLCEVRHAQYKNNFNFTIKNYRKNMRDVYVLANFISVQIMFLIKLQNNSKDTLLSNFR